MTLLQRVSSILKPCVILADNNPSVAFDGSAPTVITTIYARLVITETNIIFVIGFIESVRVMLLGGWLKRGESANEFRHVVYCLGRVSCVVSIGSGRTRTAAKAEKAK